ncbi:signal peptide prediction [Variovorax sp. HJSM1_2]|uniref:signal peptide prediction n=1 Tax=Variovorax sp. HJSM1_2 TaxID=3366263 RepID=UPI003BEA9EF3
MLGLGAKARIEAGAVEFHGGWLGQRLAALPHPYCFGAMTLGHVILATNHHELTALRTHEQVHMRQYERWGIFFLPAYALSSLWAVAHGRDGYMGNFFERQAYAAARREDPAC